MNKTLKKMAMSVALATTTAGLIIGCGGSSSGSNGAINDAEVKANYVNMAYASYSDSLDTAKDLKIAVLEFLANPTDGENGTLEAARAAYKEARKPYQQSEIMRWDSTITADKNLEADGGLASVDDWEGQVNAWPLDERKIDQLIVDNTPVELTAGLLGSLDDSLTDEQQGEVDDAADAAVIAGYNALDSEVQDAVDAHLAEPENSGDTQADAIRAVIVAIEEEGVKEANVTTGFHAIEYMLWDRDDQARGPGSRTASEFDCDGSDTEACRKAAYLSAAVNLLVDDLTAMKAEWSPVAAMTEGTLAYNFLQSEQAIDYIAQSIASMAVGELGGARLSAGLWRPDFDDIIPLIDYKEGDFEEEHDCFSDLSHVAVYYNFQGVLNAFQGSYTALDGTVISGASLGDYIRSRSGGLYTELETVLAAAEVEMEKVYDAGEESGVSFDDIIGHSKDYYEDQVAKTTQLIAVETALDELAKVEAIIHDVKDALSLDALDPDAIGETD